ncbi:hypothetical protein GP486_001566 [Trichoglossum hirsutum]|uniref:Fungal N-terminal domain-containing protein n=1 Tax=Trichoglossum hirsutum TaxID=265104 RepID=A0A9P8LGN5_9PEZI|nr:hypothetical protein GP486_001566 [Trichoglossum hirsutum]
METRPDKALLGLDDADNAVESRMRTPTISCRKSNGMDPASASVAAVGFAASILTLATAAAQSSRAIHNLWHNLRDAPEDLKRLLRTIETLELLTREIADKSHGYWSDGLPEGLRDLWNNRAELMKEDFRGLENSVAKLEKSIAGKTYSNQHIRMRVQKFFSNDKIKGYEKKLSSHVETFTLALSILSTSRGDSSLKALQEIRSRQTLEHQHLTALFQYTIQHLDSRFEDISRSVKMLESGLLLPNNTRGKPGTSPSYEDQVVWPLMPANGRSDAMRNVYWKWAVYGFPVGRIAIGVSKRRVFRKHGESDESDPSIKELEMVFTPPSWIANNIIKISLAVESTQFGGPGFKWNLSQVCHNANPLLTEAVRDSNFWGVQQLFSKGLARPTDVLAPWERSLLHEVVFCHLSGSPGSIDMCRFLIQAGADINARSMDGRLMQHEKLEQRMQQLASLLISAGADPTIYDSDGHSAISLIFSAPGGLSYLQSFLFRYIDLIKFQQMGAMETWILAAIARSVPEFQYRLIKQLEDFRTPPAISSSPPRKLLPILQLDINHQVSEIQQSSLISRTTFVRILSSRGTASMLEPLLQQGLNVNEVRNTPLSYLGEAARTGNHETMSVLLNAGADINGGATFTALDALLERWAAMDMTGTDKRIEDEYFMFEQLVNTTGIRSTDALIRAIYLRRDYCIVRLLQAGFGRKANDPSRGLYSLSGSEAVEAIKHNNLRGLQLLIEHGASLEFEDRGGYTALLHALDKGHLDLVEALVEGGAKLLQQTSIGLTALDVARENVSAGHPRKPKFLGTFGFTDQMRSVTHKEDLQAYSLLQSKLKSGGANASLISSLPNLFVSYLRAAARLKTEASTEYRQFRKRLSQTSPTEILLVALGLLVALIAFIFYKVYETLWWVIRARRAPKAAHIPVLIVPVLMCWVVWKWLG